jgi:hypothetical protein
MIGKFMNESRRHHRIPYAGPIRVGWSDSTGSPRFAVAKCIEVSESGIRIEVSVNIPERTVLQMNAERIKFAGSGTVKHTVRRGAKYILGLELSHSMGAKAVAALREPVGAARDSR